MSEIDAAAEMAGGALLGKAVEPVGDGKGGEKIPGPGECLNCATPLTGDYCSNCGQKAHLHRTLKGMFHDIVHGVLHLDGKFWRTVPMLAWRPGELTRRYVHGQRARFISPIAFYLFTVVAMFALVVSVGEIESDNLTLSGDPPAETVEEQRARIADIRATLEDMEDDDYPGASGARAGVAASLRAAERQLAQMEAGADKRIIAQSEDGARVTVDEDFAQAAEENELLLDFGNGLRKIEENPTLFFYKVQTKAYKLSWLLIPLSLPFMWLLFPFSRKFKVYDHAVFVTYSISFMMLMVIIVGLGARFGAGELLGIAAVLYAPFHMYRQLKGAYELSRAGALVRTVALVIFSWAVLAIFVAIMLALGALS